MTQNMPVIILFDNDEGAKGIRNAIKQAARLSLKVTEPYVHVVRNLYAVPTPLVSEATQSKIEDFFDERTRAFELGGKTFNDGNDFDIARHYGKKLFAEHVVKPYVNSIDFSGFQPLLTVLEDVIRVHAQNSGGETPL